MTLIDSLHAGTPEHLQLGEGVLLRDVDLDAILAAEDPAAALEAVMADPAVLIGATQEGCRFQCVPEMIDLTRGYRTPAAGELLRGRWLVSLTGVLLEMTPANAAMLLGCAGGESALAPDGSPVPTGPERVCWVGSLGEGLAAIEMMKPVSTGGFRLQTVRRGAGAMPFALTAQGDGGKAAPCRVVWM